MFAKPNAELIELLKPVHMSSVLIARVPGQDWYAAKTATYETKINHEDRIALVNAGATEQYSVQKIRVFKPSRETVTFSVPCAHCTRWIHCGKEEHEGKCKCGESYRVTFDGDEDWSLPQGMFCMDCGEPWGFSEPQLGLNPWSYVGEDQVSCNLCSHMTIGPWWVRKRRGERATET